MPIKNTIGACSLPKISIGMPVFNGQHQIAGAIESILNQSFEDFELIISDNCSTDNTHKICLSYQKKDRRIKYFRQHHNIGFEKNYVFVLNKSVGKYFMWAAVDDEKSKDYLTLNYKFLEMNSDYVASTSPTFFDGGVPHPVKMGDKSLDDNYYYERINNFFSGWHANARYYSLVRRGVLSDFPFYEINYYGMDWTWVIFLAKRGKLKRLDEGWVKLGIGGISNTPEYFYKKMNNFFKFIAPFYSVHKHSNIFLNGAPFIIRYQIMTKITFLNIRAVKIQLLYLISKTIFYKKYKYIKNYLIAWNRSSEK
jgi:glycosyltransferase involved in cell wall biosynthesis